MEELRRRRSYEKNSFHVRYHENRQKWIENCEKYLPILVFLVHDILNSLDPAWLWDMSILEKVFREICQDYHRDHYLKFILSVHISGPDIHRL